MTTFNILLFAILYALAWLGQGYGLSFTAWFAFVPLFFVLDGKRSLRQKIFLSLIAMSLAHVLAFSWFLTVPQNTGFVYAFSLLECLLAGMPLVLFLRLKTIGHIGRVRVDSWWLLPFLFGFWEWSWHYSGAKIAFFMVGVGNSQAGLPFFIQWLDIVGIEGISCWVVLINVAIYKSLIFKPLQKHPSVNGQLLVVRLGLAFVFPISYGFYQYAKYEQTPSDKDALHISLFRLDALPTGTHSFQEDLTFQIRYMEKMVHLTDSIVAQEKENAKPKSDLFVWYEGCFFQGIPKIDSFVQQVVNDANTPILTGATIFNPAAKLWNINATLLLSPNKPFSTPSVKQYFVPYWERDLVQNGKSHLFEIQNQYNKTFRIATPICFEQNVPDFWLTAARNGAEAFVQVAYEAWFGNTLGREPQISNITALRCIETKRWCARTSNGGATAIFNPLGQRIANANGATLDGKISNNNEITLLVRFPYLGILVMCCGCLSVLFYQSTRKYQQPYSNYNFLTS